MEDNRLKKFRKRVAREAAVLLYTSQEKEYKQAKKRAAKTLGIRVLPRNLEIAEELDKIAAEKEESSRKELLIQMRREALQIMETLIDFHPRLLGSVWRGTAHQNSDIDITAFSDDPKTVIDKLQKSRYGVTTSEWRSVTKQGKKESSFHIHLILPSGHEVEVAVRDLEKMNVLEKCEIYGDVLTGINHPELSKVLKEEPLRKFVSK